jgi:hypothetical protein
MAEALTGLNGHVLNIDKLSNILREQYVSADNGLSSILHAHMLAVGTSISSQSRALAGSLILSGVIPNPADVP